MNDPPSYSKTDPPTWALVVAFFLLYVTWGTTYLAIKWGVHDEHLPPALFGGTRVCLGGLIVLGFLAISGRSLLLPRREWGGILLTALLLFVGGNGLMNLAETTVPSNVAAVLAATTPLWIGILAMIWPSGERLSVRGWLGLLLGLSGVLLIFGPRLEHPSEFFGDPGPLYVLGSAGCWALGSLWVRHMRLTADHLTAAAYQMILGGGILSLLGVAIGEGSRLPAEITPGAAGAFLYLLLVGSLTGFIAYNWLLQHVPATQAGTYAYVNPVVAILVAWLFGEDLTGWVLGGMVVILIGVALVRGGEKKAIAADAKPERKTVRQKKMPSRVM